MQQTNRLKPFFENIERIIRILGDMKLMQNKIFLSMIINNIPYKVEYILRLGHILDMSNGYSIE